MIAQEIANWERLSGKKGTPSLSGNANSLSADTRRLIILGGYVADTFDAVLRFQPQGTEAENQVEFAPFIAFLALLAADREYVNRLMEQVDEAFT
jgi:hypothetical protein